MFAQCGLPLIEVEPVGVVPFDPRSTRPPPSRRPMPSGHP